MDLTILRIIRLGASGTGKAAGVLGDRVRAVVAA